MTEEEQAPGVAPWWVDPPLSPVDEFTIRRGKQARRMRTAPDSPCGRCMGRLWAWAGPPSVLVVVWCCFAGWTFVAGLALDEGINPLALTLEREILALPVMLWYAHWSRGACIPAPRDVPKILGLGILGFGNVVGAIGALEYVSTTAVVMAQLGVPVATAGLSWLFGVERGSKLKLAGVLVAVSGGLTVAYFYNQGGGFASMEGVVGSSLWWVGALLLVVQVLCAAGLAVSLRPMVRR